MTANEFKAFFKKWFGIPVRVRTAKKSHHFTDVWIPLANAPKDHHDLLVYNHYFPESLGNQCMRIVYKTSESLSAQNWGGNIGRTNIAMHSDEWEELVRLYSTNVLEK